MGKFTGDLEELLEHVGGRKNVVTVSHCVTRMRFVLNDPSKADTQTIESLVSAKGAFTQAGQFQVIVDNEVSTFYSDFAEMAGIEGVSKDAAKKAAMQSQTPLQGIMNSLAGIFAPLVPAIIVGSLILGFRNVIGEVALFNGGTKIPTQVSVFRAGINSFLRLVGEVVFHFLPMCIVWSTTKKMGTIQALGIVLGITLVSSQLLNAYSVVAMTVAKIPKWNFRPFQVDMIGYQTRVLPVVLIGLILVYLEWLFKKIYPAMISMIVVPFYSLMISMAMTHGILEPIGWRISAVIPDYMNTGLTSSFKGVFTGVFGLFYTPLVITELHHMSNVINLQLVIDLGDTALWPTIALSNIAQGSAILTMILLQKSDAKAKKISVSAYISCYLGAAEPAMFSANLKYGLPFICGMTGLAVGTVLFAVSGIKADAIGMGGIPGILFIQPQYMELFTTVMGLVILIPFCPIYAIGRKEGISGSQDDKQGSQDR